MSGHWNACARRVGLVLGCVTLLWAAAPAVRGQEPTATPESMRIAELQVAGNVSLTRQQVLAVVRTREGDLFSAQAARQDAQRIAEIEGVEYAYYNTAAQDGRLVLTYVVVEKNLVREIAFLGNDFFDDHRLAKELGFRRGDYLDVFLATSAAEAITEMYQKKGFPFVDVSLDESKLAVGLVAYHIDEGPRVKVDSIRFTGNESLESNELDDVLKTKTNTLLVFPAYYKEDVVEADVRRLAEVYQNKAFLNAQVTVQANFTEDREKVEIVFAIDEGPTYTVEELVIGGNDFFTREALVEGMRLQENGLYTDELAERTVRRIQDMYREQGFVDVQVTHRRTFLGEANVRAVFEIAEGQQFRIGRVDIIGNQGVQDRVLRRILDEEGFTPGEIYDARTAAGTGRGELETILKRTAYLDTVTITPGEPRDGIRDANVQVTEGQTGSVMLGAGVASDSGLMGQIVYDQRNFDIGDWPDSLSELLFGDAFKGAGQRFRAAFTPGTVQSSFAVSFTEPYLLDQPMSLDVVLSGFERGYDGYDIDRLRGYVELERRYEDHWRRGLGFRAEQVEVDDIDLDAPSDITDVKGTNELFGGKLFVRRDLRDNRFLPTEGSYFDSSYEQVAGDFTFGVLEATQRWYTTLYEDLAERRTVLETKLHGGTIFGDAPVFERFYAGGTGTIRGFDYRGVSPRSNEPGVADDPIGSDWMVIANAEVAVPLDSDIFSWLFFVDAGLIETGGPRVSVGTGLQILLPQWFGPVPMRFELAAPVMKEEEDELRAFTFSVGALF